MALQLKQVRPCDGECCKESPRWPNKDHSDCIYHINNGCALMKKDIEVPDEESIIFPGQSAKRVFELTCIDWPQNMPGRKTANCCWQWVNV